MKKFLKDNWFAILWSGWLLLNMKTMQPDIWFKVLAGIFLFYWGIVLLEFLIMLPMKLQCETLRNELNARKQTSTKISVIFGKKY